MGDSEQATVRIVPAVSDVAAADWDACANPDPATLNPFVGHAFLKALEDAGCVGRASGWTPRHLVLEDGASIGAVMPCYLKSHSLGEYVFDHAWADAYERAGGRYYPKLLAAVPFTPVPGPRLLVRPGAGASARETLLAAAAVEVVERLELSSFHVNFIDQHTWQRLGRLGFLQRTGQQFHWHNRGYGSFDEFLADLASRKRKAVRKERAEARKAGLRIERLTGSAITESHWDAFFAFYMDTGSRKWGHPYLNRRFFSLLGEAMADRCLLVMAASGSRYVGGALNIIGGDCLYGRYWGAIEHHPCLHFEVCYYQAIEHAIENKLPRIEAGAQGEHKLARGYVPVTTYSAHFIRDAAFRLAVARYLEEERRAVAEEVELLSACTPFRKGSSFEDR